MGSVEQQPELCEAVPVGELISESTLPLLNYFVQCRQASRPFSKIFREVKAGVGEDKRVIPDESAQLETALLSLVKNGPSGNGTRIPDAPTVTIIGAGVSGLSAGFELKKAGFDVTILEASSRVGGRVKTFREPHFAPGLHGEGGAMRIPGNHYLLRQYIDDFGLTKELFDFEMENKFIYISGYAETITYKKFCDLLQKQDSTLLSLFPELKDSEKGKTPDQLFTDAVKPVVAEFWEAYDRVNGPPSTKKDQPINIDAIQQAYAHITNLYDRYTLRSYLTELAAWSEDAINLYDLGNAHVVFENGFIESFKDAFLSSNDEGQQAGMQQLQSGTDAVPNAFIDPKQGGKSLIDNIIFGARAVEISSIKPQANPNPGIPTPVRGTVSTTYETNTGQRKTITSAYLILAIPYTSQRAITKNRAFAPKQEMAIRDVRYVEVTKILLQYKKRWWEKIFSEKGQGLDGGLVSDLPIRYTMFPKTEGNDQFKHSDRGVIMAAYTFEQDATIIGALSPERRVKIAAENIDRIFPQANSLDLLEVGASQVFPADELAGGSAFAYFGPLQKTKFLPTMMETDWEDRVFFAGEQASFTHGWIQGALEAGLRCVQQIWKVASDVNVQ